MSATAMAAPSKIDPILDNALITASPQISLAKSMRWKVGKDSFMVDCLIRTRDARYVTTYINDNGGQVRSTIGEIMTAWVPVDLLPEFDAMPEVIYVEASKPVTRKMGDSNATFNAQNARVISKASQIQDGSGSGLGGTSYNGSGVIVGIVDTGIDCDHADFNDSSGASRIIAYWDQSKSGSGVAEVAGTGGTEYTAAQIAAGTCTASPDSDSEEGHGTHVSGTAAGSNSTYKGVAPEASIISVLQDSDGNAESGGLFSSTVLDAVNYIFRKAQSTKKPAVANISLGTSLGAHDDTSNFEKGLNALLSGTQGRAIVNAQGNENFPAGSDGASQFGGIHALVDVSAGSPKGFEFMARSSSASTKIIGAGGIQVDIWLAAGGTCSVAVNAFKNSQKVTTTIATAAVSAGGNSAASDNTDSSITIGVNFTDSANANNGKQHALVTITRASSSVSSSILSNYTFDLVFSGACSGHAWLFPDVTAYVDFSKNLAGTTNALGYTYVAGDSSYTTTIPATASSVIAVGSFMGRQYWTNANGTTVDNASGTAPIVCGKAYAETVSDISLFSSLGPTADGRTKPELAAPGEPIISTLASTVSLSNVPNACRADSTHHMLIGTSMSSPHVAGVVALLLNRNGCLTVAQIKSALTGNVTTDSFTGSSLPNNSWGYGKLNALAAITSFAAATCSPDNTSEDGAGKTANLTTTTDSGGGTCALQRGGGAPHLGWMIGLFVAMLFPSFVRRGRQSRGR